MQKARKTVAVLGASDKPDRTSNLLIRRLMAQGHTVFPIHPKLTDIAGLPVYRDLASLPSRPDVLTLYVNADISAGLAQAIKQSGTSRVIFNPGAENPVLQNTLQEQGVETLEACSLVLLSQNQL